MLDKERWIYDPARCLRKTCKFPMLADSQLGNYFLKGHKPFVANDDEEKDDDDLYVRPKVKISRKSRNEINRDVADEEKDEEDSEASVRHISKPKRKRSEAPQTVRIDVPPPMPRSAAPQLNRSNVRRAAGSSSSSVGSSNSTIDSSSVHSSSTCGSSKASLSDEMIGELVEKHMKAFVGVMMRSQKDLVLESQRHLEDTVKNAMTKQQADIAAMKALIAGQKRQLPLESFDTPPFNSARMAPPQSSIVFINSQLFSVYVIFKTLLHIYHVYIISA